MTVNIYQAHSSQSGQTETVILCTACYIRWNPAGAIRLIVSDVTAPCEMCQPNDFGIHLEDMRKELDNE